MELLEGTQKKVVSNQGEKEKREKRTDGSTRSIHREEMGRQVKRLKKGNAAGEDEIINEAWIYMTEKIEVPLAEVMKKVWEEGEILEDWRKGVIYRIYKKGEAGEAKNYRGITLLDTGYKMYANILNERLKEEMEEKYEETQFGFRNGRGTSDAIYLLNFIVQRRLRKPKGKIFAFFVDLKSAFEKVDRELLKGRMEEIGISEDLRRRIMNIYKETKSAVRIGKEESEEFWTGKGVRQGCPMSPTLFNIYVHRRYGRKDEKRTDRRSRIR